MAEVLARRDRRLPIRGVWCEPNEPFIAPFEQRLLAEQHGGLPAPGGRGKGIADDRAHLSPVSPAPVWVNPRLVKEADALHEAGYDVVAGYRADGPADRDDAILGVKPWRWHRVDVARDRQPFRWMRAAGPAARR